MDDEREVYSIQDCLDIVEEQLKKQFGFQENIAEAFCDAVKYEFKYVNWYRFKNANCPGCVSGPDECDIAYGHDKYRGMWEKIVNGKIQSCPARTNGTRFFDTESPNSGIRQIDIADHKFNAIELLEPINENN